MAAKKERAPKVGDKVRYNGAEGTVTGLKSGKAVIEVVYPAESHMHQPYTWNSGKGLDADEYELVDEPEQA